MISTDYNAMAKALGKKKCAGEIPVLYATLGVQGMEPTFDTSKSPDLTVKLVVCEAPLRWLEQRRMDAVDMWVGCEYRPPVAGGLDIAEHDVLFLGSTKDLDKFLARPLYLLAVRGPSHCGLPLMVPNTR